MIDKVIIPNGEYGHNIVSYHDLGKYFKYVEVESIVESNEGTFENKISVVTIVGLTPQCTLSAVKMEMVAWL